MNTRDQSSPTVNTIDDIIRQLDEDRVLARKNGHSSAAVSATMAKARVLGLIVDKHQVASKTVNEMNESELRAFLGEN